MVALGGIMVGSVRQRDQGKIGTGEGRCVE